MIRRPPRSTRTDTLVPYTTLFRSVAKAVHHIERGLDFAERRAKPCKQSFPRLRGRDTACRSIEKPHTELRLQSAHRLAQRRCADAAGPRAFSKALCARHQPDSPPITKIHTNCQPFRTSSEERRVGTACVVTCR